MDINIPFLDKLVDGIVDWLKKDRRKTLPYKEVVIGTNNTSFLAVDIRAAIRRATS